MPKGFILRTLLHQLCNYINKVHAVWFYALYQKLHQSQQYVLENALYYYTPGMSSPKRLGGPATFLPRLRQNMLLNPHFISGKKAIKGGTLIFQKVTTSLHACACNIKEIVYSIQKICRHLVNISLYFLHEFWHTVILSYHKTRLYLEW